MASKYGDANRSGRQSDSPDGKRSYRKERSPHREADKPRRRRSPSADSEEDRRRSRKYDSRRENRDNERRRRSISASNSEASRRQSPPRRRRRDDEDDNRQVARRRDRSRSPRRRRGRERSTSRHERRTRDRSASADRTRRRSPPAKKRRRSYSRSPSRSPPRKSRGPLPSQQESFQGTEPSSAVDKPIEKQKPNFGTTGLLAKEANTVAGTNTVLKYHEPAEARKPPSREQWRMYIFKGKDMLDTVYLYQRSCWLMGRDQAVADLHLEHPSISKQHAVIQFRHITKTNEYGDRESKVKPYLIDLESANSTHLNGKKVAASSFVELLDGDVIKFGESEREYVMMLPPP